MKRSAPSNQRTGQPRCVQLAEKAMKLSALTRRSQTPLFAVTPAQGSDEGSVTVTATVLPIWKSSGLPSVTHFSGTFRKNGATMKPTNGTPTIAVHRPTSAMESFSKNRRRLISSGSLKIYERFVPAIRHFDRVRFPLGLSLWVRATPQPSPSR